MQRHTDHPPRLQRRSATKWAPSSTGSRMVLAAERLTRPAATQHPPGAPGAPQQRCWGRVQELNSHPFQIKKTLAVWLLYLHTLVSKPKNTPCRINVVPSWWTTEMVTNSMYDTRSWELSNKSDLFLWKEREIWEWALWVQKEIQA